MVYNFARIGWKAVGLEGSDWPMRLGRGAWGRYKNLFTCDISKPFLLHLKFDVITAWDVVEHLKPDGLETLCATVRQHLKDNGIWVVTTANNSDCAHGIELYQTQWPREKWVEFFIAQGFKILPRSLFVQRWQMLRHSGDGCEFVLGLITMPGGSP